MGGRISWEHFLKHKRYCAGFCLLSFTFLQIAPQSLLFTLFGKSCIVFVSMSIMVWRKKFKRKMPDVHFLCDDDSSTYKLNMNKGIIYCIFWTIQISVFRIFPLQRMIFIMLKLHIITIWYNNYIMIFNDDSCITYTKLRPSSMFMLFYFKYVMHSCCAKTKYKVCNIRLTMFVHNDVPD